MTFYNYKDIINTTILTDDYDPTDKFDKLKWNLWNDPNYNNLVTIYINNYPYKVNKDNSYNRALRLHNLRQKIDLLCSKILYYYADKNNSSNLHPELLEGILIFLDIHCPYLRDKNDIIYKLKEFKNTLPFSSKYLLSEIPNNYLNDKHTLKFDGLNKPKIRLIYNNQPHVGKDGQIRSSYRDIFLNTNKNDKQLYDLLIHELSHTMANHCRWREDDHGKDFQLCENIIKKFFYSL